jgi:hypothetical protein
MELRSYANLMAPGVALSFCPTGGFSLTSNGFALCVVNTVFVYLPFLFLVIVGYYRLRILKNVPLLWQSKPNYSILQAFKTFCTLLQIFVPIAVCTDVFRETRGSLEQLESISLIVATVLRTLMWSLSYYILKQQYAKGTTQNLYGLRGFWLLNFLCVIVSSLSAIPIYEAIYGDRQNHSTFPTQLVLCSVDVCISTILALIASCLKQCETASFDHIDNSGRRNYPSDNHSLQGANGRPKFSYINMPGNDHPLVSEEIDCTQDQTFMGHDKSNVPILDASIDNGALRESRRSFDNFQEVPGYSGGAGSNSMREVSLTKPKRAQTIFQKLTNSPSKEKRSSTHEKMWKKFAQNVEEDIASYPSMGSYVSESSSLAGSLVPPNSILDQSKRIAVVDNTETGE